jgi:homoserine kinase
LSYTVRVPASTSNLGAGFDHLGLALDVWLEASLLPGPGAPEYAGELARLDPNTDVLLAYLAECGITDRYHLKVRSDIPLSRGLGSSAAARVAAIALEQLDRGTRLEHGEVFKSAAKLEGHPDNAGPAVYGGLVLAAAHPTRLSIHSNVRVALAVPQRPVETKAARGLLPESVPRATAVAQAARAAALVTGLATGDGELIGFGMQDEIAMPHRMDLISGLADAILSGRRAGAYGVTTSGSGSTVLALAPPGAVEGVAAAMAEVLTDNDNPAIALTPDISNAGVTVQ